MPGRLFLPGMLVGLMLGAVLGAVAASQLARSPDVQVLHGFTSAVNYDGTALGLLTSPEAESGKSFSIAGASWRSYDRPGWGQGPSASGHPTCVEPLTHGQEVRLGVVRVPPVAGAVGGTVTAWIECLSPPAGSTIAGP